MCTCVYGGPNVSGARGEKGATTEVVAMTAAERPGGSGQARGGLEKETRRTERQDQNSQDVRNQAEEPEED